MSPRGAKRQKRSAHGYVAHSDAESNDCPSDTDLPEREADYSGSRAAIGHIPCPEVSGLHASATETRQDSRVPPSVNHSSRADVETHTTDFGIEGDAVQVKAQSRWKSTSTLMQDFVEKQPHRLNCLLSQEHDPRTVDTCTCESGLRREYRCVDCFARDPCCQQCMVSSHLHMPFHHIEFWTGAYFARSSLKRLGAKLCLGHSGTPCRNAGPKRKQELVVVHTNGVHKVNIIYCGCAPETQHAIQLLQVGLYSATWTDPATAFTVLLLKHCHMDSLQSRKSAYDYWAILRRMTDNTREDAVPDRYEELMRVMREWRVLTQLKRSGQALGISTLLPDGSQSVAIRCPACPRPDVNLEENWRDNLTSENRHIYTVFIGIDGNFQAVLKSKRHDRFDKPLLDGRAYFTKLGPFNTYMEQFEQDDRGEHKSDCANLKSMKPIAPRKGLIVSGIEAVFCRHSLYLANSMINLDVGEKFRILDYAVAEALRDNPDPHLHRVLTCDKGCQYSVNIITRFERAFPNLLPIVTKMKILVPKLHLQGHKEDCRYRFSLNYTPHCGRTDGEGVERPWTHSNDTARITRDQNPGHRIDTYNDSNGDWNYRKVIGMARFLLSKLKESSKSLIEIKNDLECLSRSIDPRNIRAWEAMSCEPYVPDGGGPVQSVFRARSAKMPTYQKLINQLEKDDDTNGRAVDSSLPDRPPVNRRRDKILFLTSGIEIEDSQAKIRRHIRALPQVPSNEQRDELRVMRSGLREKITQFRAVQQFHMSGLGLTPPTDAYTHHIDEDYGRPEKETLDLPSTWPASERERPGIEQLAELEYSLRVAQANRSLARLRASIQAYNAIVDRKQRDANTQRVKTRANQRVAACRREIDRNARCYKRHHAALCRLGMKPDDARLYRPLLPDDLKNLRISARRPADVGENRVMPAWFWGGDRDADELGAAGLDDLMEEEQRVRWFRLSATRDRYHEEVEILKAEMQRTLRTFAHFQALWQRLAESQLVITTLDPPTHSPAVLQGRTAYALKQASIYAQRVHLAQARLREAENMETSPAQRQKRQRYDPTTADSYEYQWSYY